jgi:GNAT superfamily N-acetyltransferase
VSVTVRPADDRDIPKLAPLYTAFLDETLAGSPQGERNPELNADLALVRLLRRERAAMLVAESSGALAGFAFVEIRLATGRRAGLRARVGDFLTRRLAFVPVLMPRRGWLAHLYVAPEARRQGAASVLVRAAADWVKSRGAASLELNVLATNEPARRLYAKLGMTEATVDYRLDL